MQLHETRLCLLHFYLVLSICSCCYVLLLRERKKLSRRSCWTFFPSSINALPAAIIKRTKRLENIYKIKNSSCVRKKLRLALILVLLLCRSGRDGRQHAACALQRVASARNHAPPAPAVAQHIGSKTARQKQKRCVVCADVGKVPAAHGYTMRSNAMCGGKSEVTH